MMFCPQHADCTFPRRKRCRTSPFKGPDLLSVENDGLEKSAGVWTGQRRQKWPTGPACKWSLCGSGLDSEMKVQYRTYEYTYVWQQGALQSFHERIKYQLNQQVKLAKRFLMSSYDFTTCTKADLTIFLLESIRN